MCEMTEVHLKQLDCENELNQSARLFGKKLNSVDMVIINLKFVV